MLSRFFTVSVFFIFLLTKSLAAIEDPSYVNFIQNKGQWNPKVLYQADFRGGRMFLEQNAFTYLFYPPDGLRQLHPHQKSAITNQRSGTFSDPNEKITLSFQVVKMEFVGSNPNGLTNQLNKKSFYHNYYQGNDPKKWASQVSISEGVMYDALYPGISLKTFSSGNNIRYDFIVNPGAQPSQIKMKFTGQDKLSLRDDKLVIGIQAGEIIQYAPRAFQLIDGKEQVIACRYTKLENELGIEITGSYNHDIPLIIDPTLVFATFTGSTADNWGMTASYDNLGNGYTAGICFGAGYPTSTGAFQANFAGGVVNSTYDYLGFDIVTSKFDPTGAHLLFSTYLGGSDNDQPQSIIVDNANNLLVYGRTYSADFPVTAGAYDLSHNGGSDMIITKFNTNGTALLASTYVGGSLDDGVNISGNEGTRGSLKYNYADDGRGDIILDSLNNVYIASCTQSTDFPVTSGCFQSSNKGVQDACALKLSANLSTLIWSSYLGGSANDAAYNLALDNTNGVYVTGGTESADFNITPGAFHAAYGGNIDGFLTHISSNGNSLLQSTYIGTSGYDQSYFVQLDASYNVYIYGQTSGSYPVTAGVYSNPNSGQFIHAFNPGLTSTLFSTVFGTGQQAPDIAPSAFLVDKCNNIYISGWGGQLGGYNIQTSTTTGLPVTSNAFQSTTDGMDFYFMVLKPNAVALWYATYFGGDNGSEEHVDGGTSRFDKAGVIYQAICEGCAVNPNTNYVVNQDMPTTPNAWSTTDKSNNCNNALVKFSFDLIKASAALQINPTTATGCAPFPVSFTNQSQNATQFSWTFGDGSSAATTNATHTYTTPGIYSVSLAATNTGACYSTDTIVATITVFAPPLVTATNATVCPGSSATLSANGASTYSWSNGATGTTMVQAPQSTTQYTVTGTDNHSCTNTAIATITTLALPVITVSSASVCPGGTATLTASGANSYTWNTGDTSSSIIQSPSISTTYSVTGINQHFCKNSASGSLIIYPLPAIQTNQPSICIGNTATLTASGANTYTWSNGNTGPHIMVSPTVASTFTVTGASIYACINTATTQVIVNPLPIIHASNDTICYGTSAWLTASGANSYTWSTGNTGSGIAVSPSLATSYTVSGMDLNSCINTATLTVQIDSVPQISVSNATVCIGSTATLTASGSNTYTWSTSQISNSITVNPSQTSQYTVSSANANCTTNKTCTVFVVANHTQLSQVHTAVCIGDSLKLFTTLPYVKYLWNTGQQSPSIEVTQAGTYVVHTIDMNGCIGEDSIHVLAYSPIPISLHDTSICKGQSVQLVGPPGNYLYIWTPPSGLNNPGIYNPIANPTSSTTYMLNLINGACTTTNSLTVLVNPVPHLQVEPAYSFILEGENVSLHALSTDSCNWYPNNWLSCSSCNTTIAAPALETIYTVTATNQYGCTTISTATVQVDLEATLYIPNSFSPNGDGMNEVFKPIYNHVHNIQLLIFDRWGLLIFRSSDTELGWDGTYKNGKCQEDVYVYKLDYIDDPTNRLHSVSGQVTLIR